MAKQSQEAVCFHHQSQLFIVATSAMARPEAGGPISREFGKSVDWLLTGEEKK